MMHPPERVADAKPAPVGPLVEPERSDHAKPRFTMRFTDEEYHYLKDQTHYTVGSMNLLVRRALYFWRTHRCDEHENGTNGDGDAGESAGR